MVVESLPDLSVVHRAPGGLLEAPRYDPALGLLFSDARRGGVYRLPATGECQVVIAHRRGIGGLALHEEGGLVVSGRNVAHKALDTDEGAAPTVVLLDATAQPRTASFNDLTVDGQGRVYVGSLATGALEAAERGQSPDPGAFFLIDLDGSSRVVADRVLMPNGTAHCPDGSLIYLADSARRLVFRFHVDEETGALGNQEVAFEVDAGVPDGVAGGEDGSIWVALAHAGMIGRYDQTGRLVQKLEVPDPMVTSLCFGGEDGRSLYVTSAARTSEESAAIFVGKADVAGTPIPKSRVVGPSP